MAEETISNKRGNTVASSVLLSVGITLLILLGWHCHKKSNEVTVLPTATDTKSPVTFLIDQTLTNGVYLLADTDNELILQTSPITPSGLQVTVVFPSKKGTPSANLPNGRVVYVSNIGGADNTIMITGDLSSAIDNIEAYQQGANGEEVVNGGAVADSVLYPRWKCIYDATSDSWMVYSI